MSLRDKAVLEIDLPNRTGVFELEIGLDETAEINKSFVMGGRGQYIREIYENLDELGDGMIEPDVDDPGAGSRRQGYHVDGGAGEHTHTLSFESGQYDGRWGDGSSNSDNPDGITKYDAQGAHPVPAKQVLEYYVAQARTDSGGQARLHIGEWTDGSYSSSAGVFEGPAVVAIRSLTSSRDTNDTSSFEGTLEFVRTATFPGWIEGTADAAVDYILDR